jgi:hypothetical protein
MKKILFSTSLIGLCALYIACGGGSDGKQFLGMNIKGVSYTTSSGKSGVTNEKGEFDFKKGDTVTFKIGNVEILKTDAEDTSILGLTKLKNVTQDQIENILYSNRSDVNMTLRRLFNIALLLFTLDKDRDPSNGIEITEDIATKFKKSGLYPLDFTEPRFEPKIRKVLYQTKLERKVANPLVMVRFLKNVGLLGPSPMYLYSKIEDDNNGDGTIDEIRQYTYDKDGNIIRYTRDTDANGLPNTIDESEYNSFGDITLSKYDSDGNGTPDSIGKSQYDSNGNRTRYSNDNDANGTDESIYTYTYNAYGDRLVQRDDNDANGSTDYERKYFYDSNGNLIKEEIDSNYDGTVDQRRTYTYDNRGNRLTRLYIEIGVPANDELDSYTFDANNNQIKREIDYGANGSINYRQTSEYNEFHQVTSDITDSDGNGTPNSSSTYSYNDRNNYKKTTYDSNADGTPNEITNYSYTKDGLLSESLFDSDGNGTPNQIRKYTYDSNLSLIKYEEDLDANGTADSSKKYTQQKFEKTFPFRGYD